MPRKISLGLLALALFLVAGCATPRKAPEIVWPLPPEPPRIKYVKSISAVEDIQKKSIFTRMKEILVGKDATARLGKPYAVHARGGRIYVADSAWKKVLVFDTEKHDFFVLGLEGPGMLAKPLGVTTDSQGRIYVTDTAQNRAVVYDRDGNFLFAMGEKDRFDQPVGIAVYEPLKRIYIVDTRKHIVSVFDMEGKFLFDFGGRGTEDGKLNFPTNISIDKEGKVYVMDTFNFRVQIFDPDGKLLNKFGGIGRAPGLFSKPKGIGVDSEGHIYVVDAAFSNVQIFDQQGRLLLFFGEFGDRPWQFWLPAGLYIDEQDQIYVADQYNKKINIYQYLPEKPVTDTGKGSQQIIPGVTAVSSGGIGGVTARALRSNAE
jgi:DNA-binding beta-propeller fold protein YncE